MRDILQNLHIVTAPVVKFDRSRRLDIHRRTGRRVVLQVPATVGQIGRFAVKHPDGSFEIGGIASNDRVIAVLEHEGEVCS